MFSRYWLHGRRRGGRREGEVDGIYVDRYRPSELWLVAGILVMSGVDLWTTLLHLEFGGSEANPMLAWTYDAGGDLVFALVKVLATGLGAFALLVHVRFVGVRCALQVLVWIYALVMLWHAVVAVDRLWTVG